MKRPTQFAHYRYVGDKRTQVAYDVDSLDDTPANADMINELMAAQTYLCFGPDTEAEARNRGYRIYQP